MVPRVVLRNHYSRFRIGSASRARVCAPVPSRPVVVPYVDRGAVEQPKLATTEQHLDLQTGTR